MARSSAEYYHCLWDQLYNYQLLSVTLLKYPKGHHLDAVDPSQLWTIVPEMVDPIDWQLQFTIYMALPPDQHLHNVNARNKSVYLGQDSIRESPTLEETAMHICDHSGFGANKGTCFWDTIKC